VSGKKLICIGLILGCLCAAIYFTSSRENHPAIGYDEAAGSYTVSKTLRFSYTLQNTSNRVLSDIAFVVRLPLQQTPSQQIIKLSCSQPHQIIGSPSGAHTLKIDIDTFPPFASKIVQVRVDLMMAEQPNASWESSPSKYLQAEDYIETESAEIQKTAVEISLGLQGQDAAMRIGRWVSDHIAYSGYVRNQRGALYALRTGSGDCTEHMHLFVALCRAAGIPARGVAGYACERSRVLSPLDYHNWAEVHLDDRWVIVDPQKRIFGRNTEDYVATGIIGATDTGSYPRFQQYWCSSDRVSVKMNGM
jgi:transglutaminase/protease-like cytokinesis protein 3